MKTSLLASATVLALGMGAAFAATSPTGFNPAGTTQTSNDPSTTTTGTAPAGAPMTYAYMTRQGLMPRAEAPALPVARPTPLGALEAYQSDAAGAGG